MLQIKVYGYLLVPWRQYLTWFFIILTLGLLKLFLYWLPHWEVMLTHKKVNLSKATMVIIKVINIIHECNAIVVIILHLSYRMNTKQTILAFTSNLSKLLLPLETVVLMLLMAMVGANSG